MSDTAAPRDAAVTELLVEVRYLRRDIEGLQKKIEATDTELEKLQGLVNKYRGGVAVILGAGALMGWLVSTLSSGLKLWSH